MKKIGIVGGGLVLFMLVFWLGLIINFPGEAFSRLIETRINQSGDFKVSASPATLGLTGIYMENVKIVWERSEGSIPVGTAREVYLPLSWRLFTGLELEVKIGKAGRAEVYYPWDGKSLSLKTSEIRLEDFKGWATFKNILVKGVMDMEGNLSFSPTPNSSVARAIPASVRNRLPGRGAARSRSLGARSSRFQAAGAGLPSGTITGNLTQVEISNLEVVGAKIPPIRLDSVAVGLRLGNRIEVEKAAFRGDFQGSVSGGVTPVGQDLANAKLDLKLTVAVRQAWLRNLGTLGPIIEVFVKDGQLEGSVQGTPTAPSWIPGGKR